VGRIVCTTNTLRRASLIRLSLSFPVYLEEPKLVTALRQAIVQETGQVIEPAAFSRILVRLERRGLIASEEGSERVRLYHLTASGMLALQQAEELYRRDQEEQEWNGWSPDLSGRKEIIMRLVLWILRLYPPAWRERYEMEMAALLEQHQLTFWTVLDLLVGAMDARLDPHYRRARQLLPLRRVRTSWQLAIAAFVAFWIALLPWLWLSVLGIDSDTQCENTISLAAPGKSRKALEYFSPQPLVRLHVSRIGGYASRCSIMGRSIRLRVPCHRNMHHTCPDCENAKHK
jgi:DNA-binding PadR family transcriptional regulator